MDVRAVGQPRQPEGAVPHSFLAALPWLWRRILFPAATASGGPWCGRALLLLLLLPGVLLYPCLSFYLFEPDEGRYAEIPREMLARADWVVPYLQGEPYLDKPPLFYWLVMLSYSAFGVHDWSARLVPALAVHLTVLLTYLLGRRTLGERPAFWGALLLSLAPGFIGMGRLLILDGVLTLWVALALFTAFEAVRDERFGWGWWCVSAAASGLGILTKGPVALLLLIPPLLLQHYLAGSRLPGRRAWLVFLGSVASVALPWYLLGCWCMPDFLYHFFWVHNVLRFLEPFDHQNPVWYYGPLLLVGLLPATLFLAGVVRSLLARAGEISWRSREAGFFLLAGLWCVFFFSLSGCKLPTYILPAFPPLALVFGAYLAGSGWLRTVWPRVVAFAFAGLIAVGHFWLVPWYARYHSPMNRPDEVFAYCADRETPIICYPRPVDSVSFYVNRDDFRSYRSKETPKLLQHLLRQPTTVVLFSHRHSYERLHNALPPQLRLVRRTTLGLCDMAVVERVRRP
jgi:4-amino-4-deoxy-L-arabinose transferase-like glycosyltransferase